MLPASCAPGCLPICAAPVPCSPATCAGLGPALWRTALPHRRRAQLRTRRPVLQRPAPTTRRPALWRASLPCANLALSGDRRRSKQTRPNARLSSSLHLPSPAYQYSLCSMQQWA
ncbi:hypothetical protein BS78_07G084600 [Paspalum vaginatum]|nr:hypothetical protein BS78_07G084600 [Paspalum vaginatum]